MDLLLISRDALSSSLLSNTLMAVEAKKAGADVGVLFTQEALAAVCGGSFAWPPALTGQEVRYKMADSAKAMDVFTILYPWGVLKRPDRHLCPKNRRAALSFFSDIHLVFWKI